MPPRLCRAVQRPLATWMISPPSSLKTFLYPVDAMCDAHMSGRSISTVWNIIPATWFSSARKCTACCPMLGTRWPFATPASDTLESTAPQPNEERGRSYDFVSSGIKDCLDKLETQAHGLLGNGL